MITIFQHGFVLSPFFPNSLEVVLGQTIHPTTVVYQLVKGTSEVKVRCFEFGGRGDIAGDQDAVVDKPPCRL